ncbi:hypothetical protein LIA77_03796 [Sarocladium implicatum]|nr:hypothetical protein LIA77_03796 [Sarocladium implicatum]
MSKFRPFSKRPSMELSSSPSTPPQSHAIQMRHMRACENGQHWCSLIRVCGCAVLGKVRPPRRHNDTGSRVPCLVACSASVDDLLPGSCMAITKVRDEASISRC